ncbi:hypothetical protein CAI21_04715 [Alkalilimnicola ehrlichii]|uniref:Uncharacterized protein n=1 Tax=Alkalilimnicola ehrlichii TaxID=351052 RepID=A0A3E0WZC5_9GAMM|nr:hypothetical protein [Alkalilimnicola ehrlichii]RFA30810.1 hypothetical protein CAI21_04715 [Alkalilimnicola ehrlichii]RFA38386.1 hypothetical protein CAL65_06080 [Alkalilimnicola ehrlichii]
MKLLLRHLMLVAMLSAVATASANQATTAFDGARILAGHSGPLDRHTLDQLFGTAFTANMRVPPEHLGVAFYDIRSGKPLDRREIRELMGPIRQDGAHEVLAMIAPLLQDQLPLDVEQLKLLMDAAFIASMRQPPQHIDIEYYDRRIGPSGRGGGISGSVPDYPPEQSDAQRQTGRELLPPHLPANQAELAAKVRTIDFGITPADAEGLLFPVVVWGRPGDDFDALKRDYLEEAAEVGLDFLGLVGEPYIERRDGWVIVYALGRFATTDDMLAAELRDFMDELQ